MSSLPTPRAVLSSLLSSIVSIPAPPASSTSHLAASTTSGATNPLSLLLQQHPAQPGRRDHHPRALLLTLHVLFPTLVLPALDLLDRRLVSHVVVVAVASGGQSVVEEEEGGERSEPDAGFYVVRSAAASTGRGSRFRRRGASGADEEDAAAAAAAAAASGMGDAPSAEAAGDRTYLVQTRAWNCTCAAFAFAAFPPVRPAAEGAGGGADGQPRPPPEEEMRRAEGAANMAWRQFGGLTLPDGGDEAGAGDTTTTTTTAPPCCKHLLACALAERWADVLGRYVARRRVSREEAAGIAARE